jgi:uncharacterized tellurite resistance protein B-like protein
MFKKFAQLLHGEKHSLTQAADGKPTDKDVLIAVGILLLDVAGSDEDYAPEETDTIFEVMEKHFNISNEKALEVLETADKLRERDRSAVVEVINQNFSAQQKERVFAIIWRVIVADGRVDRLESRLAAELRTRLQLTEEQVERAKKAVEIGQL